MKRVTIKFLHKELFHQYFGSPDIISGYLPHIVGAGEDWITYSDDVINNDERGAKSDALSFIKELIEDDSLLEGKKVHILDDADNWEPFSLYAQLADDNNRTLCHVLKVKDPELND